MLRTKLVLFLLLFTLVLPGCSGNFGEAGLTPTPVVTVISKKMEALPERESSYLLTHYYVSVKRNDTQMSFEVTKGLYGSLQVGDTVILMYAGNYAVTVHYPSMN